MASIEARGLTKAYGKHVAVKGIDLCRARAHRRADRPNGAGKTTALKAMLGLTPFQTQGGARPVGRARSADAGCVSSPMWRCCRAGLQVQHAIDFVAGVHPKFDRAKAERFLARTVIKARARWARSQGNGGRSCIWRW